MLLLVRLRIISRPNERLKRRSDEIENPECKKKNLIKKAKRIGRNDGTE